ncbi:glycosyltransferase [Empedobacter falsenii]
MIIENKQITLILPIFNAEKYLNDCLESIKNQSYINFEVLLINDGSKDKSEEICKNYSANDYRFKYFSQENKGVSEARNLGIKNASTKWICFVDPDDSIDKDYLKSFIDNINDDKTLIVSDFNRISSRGKSKNILGYQNEVINLKDSNSKLVSNVNYLVGNPFNKLFNRSIIDKYDIKFLKGQTLGQDRLFYYEYLNHVDYLKIIDSSEYNYFYRENSSITRLHKPEVYLNLVEAENKIFEKSDSVATDLKIRYTKLFLQYIKSVNKKNSSKQDKIKFLLKYKDSINSKYLVDIDNRTKILNILYKFRLYRILLLTLNIFLK